LQGYWQSAIAAKPSAAHTGYLLGGIMWFCIPFTLATTMGLAALAADLPITIAEAGAGDTSARKQFHTHVLERPHSGHHLRMLPELQSFLKHHVVLHSFYLFTVTHSGPLFKICSLLAL